MSNYKTLSPQLTHIMQSKNACRTDSAGFDDQFILRRRDASFHVPTPWRSAHVQDIEKILHCPYYNRYSDKTQVFSLLRNDDITRRSLHVQLVSRIARTIGSALGLNLDLIEAISLGHDIGHTPFAHSGENFLDELFFRFAGRHFSHSIHSVRVLDGVFPLNLSLQVLDGIACHNGEIELPVYEPVSLPSFEAFDEKMEQCYRDKSYVRKLMPSTLEGAVVRISDIIAYLGKDRQDAARMKLVDENAYTKTLIGSNNAEIAHNLMVNIIENSYGKPYIRLDDAHFEALKIAKKENGSRIYESESVRAKLSTSAKPMMAEIYEQMLSDLTHNNTDSPIFQQHINYVNSTDPSRPTPYEASDPNQIVVDYIASMTDDYLIDLHHYLFPNSTLKVDYIGYFDTPKGDIPHV